jgi:hypothetical protein
MGSQTGLLEQIRQRQAPLEFQNVVYHLRSRFVDRQPGSGVEAWHSRRLEFAEALPGLNGAFRCLLSQSFDTGCAMLAPW